MIAILLLLLALEPVALRISPRHGFAPLTVRAEIVIPKHRDNRGACVTLEGPLSYESCWEMAGELGALVTVKAWKELPAGHYAARARLLRGTHITYSNLVSFQVAGEEEI